MRTIPLQAEIQYLAPKALAARYSVTTVTLWRWRQSPSFPRPLKCGRTVRFDAMAVDAFLKSQGV